MPLRVTVSLYLVCLHIESIIKALSNSDWQVLKISIVNMHAYVYSGTSLLRTFWDPVRVSSIKRCPFCTGCTRFFDDSVQDNVCMWTSGECGCQGERLHGLLRKHLKAWGKVALYQVLEFVQLHQVVYACFVCFQSVICIVAWRSGVTMCLQIWIGRFPLSEVVMYMTIL